VGWATREPLNLPSRPNDISSSPCAPGIEHSKVKTNMEQDQQSLRQYAWNYVSFYGGQRARLLLLFAAVGSGVTLGAAGLLRTEATEIVVAPLGVMLMVLASLFWIVNRGLSAKVRHGEEALRHLDAELKLPNAKSGAPHVLRLLEQGGGEGAASKCCGCDTTVIGSAVYILFALLGFFFTVAPYYPKVMAVAPVVLETPAPLVKATPHRLPPSFARPTPDFGQRRFPGSTSYPGGPNRLNNFPGRPAGMPQPGVPAGAPGLPQPGAPNGMPPRITPPTGAAPAGAVPPGGVPNGALQPRSIPGSVQPGRPAIVPAAPAPAASAPPAPASAAPAAPSPAQPPTGKQ